MDTTESALSSAELPALLSIAGFWRRLGAFIIDLVLLGIVGLMIGAVFFDPLARMGSWARVIGFAIALAYFGLLDSRLYAGRTLGNRWLGVRVVSSQGGSLSIPRSLVRYAVLGLPFFLNSNLLLAKTDAGAMLLGFFVTGSSLATIYLYLFNRRNRQSLHDLIVGSYVVRGDKEGSAAAIPTLWRGHLLVIGLIFAVGTFGQLIPSYFLKKPLFASMFVTQEALSGLPHVRTASFVDGVSYINGERSTNVAAQLRLDIPGIDDQRIARQAAQLIFNTYPDVASKSTIKVDLIYGYDMGIARGSKTHQYSFRPTELMGDPGKKAEALDGN